LLRDYEQKLRRGLNALSWLIARINTPPLRDMFMASIDLFSIRNGLVAVLAGTSTNCLGSCRRYAVLSLLTAPSFLLGKLVLRFRKGRVTWDSVRNDR
jgi:hypothetical protein